jgi:ligand-binding sensor domain-containing protein
MITPADGHAVAVVQTFGEAQGVRGDVVADIARGPNGNIYAATPDGIGAYNGERWDFALPGVGSELRAIALATDTDGVLWGAGPRGVWRYDGHAVAQLAARDGLPAHPVEDIAIDGENRVWLSSEDGLTILARGTEPTASETTDTASSGGDETP